MHVSVADDGDDVIEHVVPHAVAVLWNILGVVFSVLPFALLLFGSNRGTPNKRTNYYSACAAIYLISFVCTMYNSDALRDDVLDPELILRFNALPYAPLLRVHAAVFGLLLALGSLLITYRTSMGNQIDIIYHTLIAVMLPITWLFTAVSEEHVCFWLKQTASFAFLLFLQLLSGARSRVCLQPVYVRSVLFTFFVWNAVFFITTGLGPWFLHVIPLLAQEIVLFISNFVFVCNVIVRSQFFASIENLRRLRATCMFGDLHHLMRAGQYRSMEPGNRAAFRKAVHRFRPGADHNPAI